VIIKITNIFLFVLLAIWANCQTLSGVVIDDSTNKPISGVNVFSEEVGTSSNSKGEFVIHIKSLPSQLTFSHIAYKELKYDLVKSELEELGYSIRVKLTFDSVDLIGPEIFAKPKPILVFENKLRHVSDFEFIDNQLIVLTYESQKSFKSQEEYGMEIFNEARIYLTDENQNIKDSLSFGKGEYKLDKSFRNLPILKTKKEIIQFSILSDKIDTTSIPKAHYESLIKPTIDSIGDMLYVSNFNSSFPAFEYYAFNKKDSSYAMVKSISDDFGVEMMRSEYKYLTNRQRVEAMNMSIRTGIDKKIIGAYMRGFQSQTYFETPYSPLFVMNDTILIFDHYQDHLYKISRWNNVIDSIGFSYHKKERYDQKMIPNNSWNKELYLDKIESRMWTSYNKNGFTYLKEIDLKDASLGMPNKLSHRYIEKLQIRDGFAYYVYRPFESSLKKYLYKEKLTY